MSITRLGASRRDTGSQMKKIGIVSSSFEWRAWLALIAEDARGSDARFARRGRLLQGSEVEIDNRVPWTYHWRQGNEGRDA